MIPRSWNDFGAEPFASFSAALVDFIADDGEGSFANSIFVGFECPVTVFFTRFEELDSSGCETLLASLFLVVDIYVASFASPHASPAVASFIYCVLALFNLALSIRVR